LSGKFENWSVKNKNPQKSGKSQGKIIFKDTFFSITSIGFGSLLALNIVMIIFHTHCKIKQTFLYLK